MTENKNKYIDAFVLLGQKLEDVLASGQIEPVIAESIAQNRWFTRHSITEALHAITKQMLSKPALTSWINNYEPYYGKPKNVAIIMAGNIPLVGFSDMLAVIISGHNCIIKPSSKDYALTNYVANLLTDIIPDAPIAITSRISTPDALIATGNDNTIRSLKARYGDIPAIFRGSRISVAIISGNETDRELSALSDDIFSYSGLGCRNVSHIFIPEGYDMSKLCSILSQYREINEKYRNNYRQNKALSVLTGKKFIDGGFYTLTESDNPGIFISEITYSRYNNLKQIEQWLNVNDYRIQCVVIEQTDNYSIISHSRQTGFGQAQFPTLTDYPDGIDVMKFLRTFEQP